MRPVPYTADPERVFLAGLEETSVKRKRFCSQQKGKFAWLRMNTCVQAIDTESPRVDLTPIISSRNVAELFHDTIPYAQSNQEHCMLLALDSKNVPLGIALLHVGGLNSSMVDQRVVFQPLSLIGAISFILAHNHPSDAPTPSQDDIDLTERCAKSARILSFNFLDHLILTSDPKRYYSFLDAGLMLRMSQVVP